MTKEVFGPRGEVRYRGSGRQPMGVFEGGKSGRTSTKCAESQDLRLEPRGPSGLSPTNLGFYPRLDLQVRKSARRFAPSSSSVTVQGTAFMKCPLAASLIFERKLHLGAIGFHLAVVELQILLDHFSDAKVP